MFLPLQIVNTVPLSSPVFMLSFTLFGTFFLFCFQALTQSALWITSNIFVEASEAYTFSIPTVHPRFGRGSVNFKILSVILFISEHNHLEQNVFHLNCRHKLNILKMIVYSLLNGSSWTVFDALYIVLWPRMWHRDDRFCVLSLKMSPLLKMWTFTG